MIGTESGQVDSVATFTREGGAFARRHEQALGQPAATFGGLAWGLLRAIAECPHCPGTFRVALDADWTLLHCRACGTTWEYREPQPELEPRRRRGGAR